MKVQERGHVYQLENKLHEGSKPEPEQALSFVNQQPGQEHSGTTTQEVLRALIDRTRHCANCMPHPVNKRIVYHLRMALTLHEARALERRVEKGEIRPEFIPTVGGSHWELGEEKIPEGPCTKEMLESPLDGAKRANYGVKDTVEFAKKLEKFRDS